MFLGFKRVSNQLIQGRRTPVLDFALLQSIHIDVNAIYQGLLLAVDGARELAFEVALPSFNIPVFPNSILTVEAL
jgi:hypothetical protein